jgi:hypothetical protein
VRTCRSIIQSVAAVLAAGLCLSGASAQCTQPNGNGQLYNAAGADLGGSSSQNIAGSFFTSDNVTVAADGTINSVCFWGRYSTTNVPAANVEQFRITFYSDAGGFPSGTILGGPFTVNQASGLTKSAIAGGNGTGAVWTAPLTPGVAVTAGQCIWMEILGDTPGAAVVDRWRWSVHNNAAASPFEDGHAAQRNDSTTPAYTVATRVANDYSWAINLAMTTAGCQIPPAANSLCSSAQAVAVPNSFTSIDATRGQLVPTIPCKGSSVSGPGLWYSVVGDGTTYSASSCGATNYDTVIGVYCGSCTGTNNAGLNCIDSNDTAATTCAGVDSSSVSWPTTSGVTYYVCVYGFEQAVGTILDLQFATDGVQAATHPPCASDFCPVDLTGIPPANFEADACGIETNGTDCDVATNPGIQNIVVGQTYSGTVQTDGPIRDRDFWELSGGLPSTTYRLQASAEIPTVIFTFNGPCVPATSLGTTNIAAAFTYCDAFDQEWTTDATGVARVMVTTNRFYGLPCSLNRNNYKFTVTIPPVGACCQPFTACQVTTLSGCNTVTGFVWTSGGACSPVDACSGVCCTGTTCVVAGATDCTAAGTSFIAGGTCSPNSCAPAGVCCRGATCNSTITSAGACTASGAAGAFFATGTGTCNSGPVSNSPCCYANYNKVNGITVQDIFDFLGDWFAGNPFANTGGTGAAGSLNVQNIFDFLSDWFNGGCI